MRRGPVAGYQKRRHYYPQQSVSPTSIPNQSREIMNKAISLAQVPITTVIANVPGHAWASGAECNTLLEFETK